jgi:hypothetical protein
LSFAKFLFLPSWFAKLLQANFSCFAKKMDAKLICQTVGVALTRIYAHADRVAIGVSL